jgi:hypothetical protein
MEDRPHRRRELRRIKRSAGNGKTVIQEANPSASSTSTIRSVVARMPFSISSSPAESRMTMRSD